MSNAKNYKDSKAWEEEGVKFNTTNNVTCKMYDAAVKQMCTREDDPAVGGVQGAVEKMMDSDPNFIMGHICKKYTGVFGGSNDTPSIEDLAKAQWSSLSEMERSHCHAAKYYSLGQGYKACTEWEKILRDHPKDYLALKMLYETQLTLGEFEKQKNVVATVLPHYSKQKDVEYGYVTGMLAFSLQETGSYDEAEKRALEALSLNRADAWSTHSMAHVHEMTGRYKEGISFLQNTQKDWEKIYSLRSHHHWHCMLFYIEKGDVESALALYDAELAPGIRNGDMFPISDAAGALYRLKMVGIDAGKERWGDLGKSLPGHMSDHGWAYYDATIMLGLCGSGLPKKADTFLAAIKSLASKNDGSDISLISGSVNQHLCEAIKYYEDGKYDQAVEEMLPHEHKIIQIGGSNAQRDVFHLLLINAARRSSKEKHRKMASKMLSERKQQKDTPFTALNMRDISQTVH